MKIECTVCEVEIDPMDVFRGEPMCQKCYHEKENLVFDSEEGDSDE